MSHDISLQKIFQILHDVTGDTFYAILNKKKYTQKLTEEQLDTISHILYSKCSNGACVIALKSLQFFNQSYDRNTSFKSFIGFEIIYLRSLSNTSWYQMPFTIFRSMSTDDMSNHRMKVIESITHCYQCLQRVKEDLEYREKKYLKHSSSLNHQVMQFYDSLDLTEVTDEEDMRISVFMKNEIKVMKWDVELIRAELELLRQLKSWLESKIYCLQSIGIFRTETLEYKKLCMENGDSEILGAQVFDTQRRILQKRKSIESKDSKSTKSNKKVKFIEEKEVCEAMASLHDTIKT